MINWERIQYVCTPCTITTITEIDIVKCNNTLNLQEGICISSAIQEMVALPCKLKELLLQKFVEQF